MNEEKSFFDLRTILAIVLVGVIWLGWELHLSKKYKNANPPIGTVDKTALTAGANSADPKCPPGSDPAICSAGLVQPTGQLASQPGTQTIDQQSGQQNVLATAETITPYEDSNLSFEISSKGMALKNIRLKKYTDRQGQPVVLGNAVPNGEFQTSIFGSKAPIDFNVRIEGNRIFGVAEINGVKIEKEYLVKGEDYNLETKIVLNGLTQQVPGISLSLSEKVEEATSNGFLMPAMDQQALYIAHGTTSVHEKLSETGEGKIGESFTNVSTVALGSLYFTMAVVDSSDIQPQFEASYSKSATGLFAQGQLSYIFPQGTTSATLVMKTFTGPKDLSLLRSIDPKLEGAVDYWVLSSIAKPMLKLMKWLHSVFGNWGVAIILLTLIVRTLVLPLYVASFKSTKAMQKIQPQMKVIREKYKDNPQTMNAEVMKLFKENKVNPLGGCLPMLLQLPIFLALYRVLSQSIELYQAPFALWIHDLSVKDPYYVIPVLMGIAMFFQQKITPMTTMDPAQQKVMMFMPILFSFMMLSLPSGLTLYILVSTLFGIVQQLIFVRDKSKNLVPAKA